MQNFNLDALLHKFPELKEKGINLEVVSKILPTRIQTSSKHDFGHAILIAGSENKTGAAILATKACLRSGAGLTSVHVPNSCRIALNISCPEAMLSLDANENFISEIPDLKYKTAIGIGPGIGLEKVTSNVLETILHSTLPKVIDADALNLLAQNPSLFQYLNDQTIITPHFKEFDRLTKVHQTWEERFITAKEFVKNYPCILILKTPNTLIFSPDGKVFFNTTGNVGLAKGGSGDVLTGIITAYLAQGLSPINAALAGVYNHGLAADFAVEKINTRSLIASDVVEFLKKIN